MDQQQAPDTSLHFLDYWRVIRSRKEIILAVMLLVLVTTVLYAYSLPPKYRAQARILVREDVLDVPVFEREFAGGWNPYFLKTQFEIIKSRPIMYTVAANLDLARLWGEQYNANKSPLSKENTIEILSSSVDVAQSRDTSLIAILVKRENPEEAAKIANEVAEVYREQRLSVKRGELKRGIDAIRGEVEKQRERVNAQEKEVERLRKELGVSMLSSGGPAGTGYRVDKIRLQQLEADRIAARVDMLYRKAQMEQFENMTGSELMESSSVIVQDQEIMTIRRQLVDTDVQLKLMLETYGENHPDVLRAKAGRDELQKKMDSALQGLKRGMRTQYEVSLARLEALEAELKAAREADIVAEGEKFLPFTKAERDLELERSVMQAMEARVRQEAIKLEVPSTPVELIDPAEPPPLDRPVEPRTPLYIFGGFIGGLVLGIALAFFIEYLDTSVKTVDDVERYLGLPVIGVIPQKVRPMIEDGPDSPYAEAYRVLRTNLLFANKGVPGGAFAMTSGGVGEGKSTTLFNLAYVCAAIGDKVLVVDSDLRRPVQHTIMGMQNRFGLTNVLMRDVPIEETIKPVPNVPNLHFLPSGKLPRSSVGVLNTQRMRELIKNLKARYDYVFFDSPPVVGVSDASILASEVDGVMLVVQYRKYPRVMSLRAKRMVENVGGKLVGVVLNNINIMRDDYYYYYHSYYSNYYYRAEPSKDETTVKPA
ncbi:MAG: polysaccharide biosynthesis tyrosine autokinase [Lentisphaerae bacterium]|nr:polysaccharide biosynthesis tyrosine autokinase [Lentisphaerota bacterium]